MNFTRTLSAVLVVSVLTACGGGGGGGGGEGAQPSGTTTPPPAPNPPAPPPAPTGVQLTLTTPPISQEIPFGEPINQLFQGRWTATTAGIGQVYLQLVDQGGAFPQSPPLAFTDPAYNIRMQLANTVLPGLYEGTMTVRACEDAQCARPYVDASQTVSYRILVKPSQDWETTQGNATHTGYLPIRITASRIVKAWDWQLPVISVSGTLPPINSVATWQRSVFVSARYTQGGTSMYALNERDGSLRWVRKFEFGSNPSLSPPAASDGKVFIATGGNQDAFLWFLDARDGTVLAQSPVATNYSTFLPPTIKDGRVYFNAGKFNGQLYAFDQNTGALLWEGPGGTPGLNTPSIDDEGRLYASNPRYGLSVYDSATGDLLEYLGVPPPPSGMGWQPDYHAAMMLGLPDTFTTFGAEAANGSAVGTQDPPERTLSHYSFANDSEHWQSAKKYRGYPAVAKGVVYAASNTPLSFDAIDERTGYVLWSWVPTKGDTGFFRNVVVTDNLAFVSTDRALYAIDLVTHQPVWESPTPGMVSISASRMLYVTTGTTESNGRMVAFRAQW